MHAIRILVVIKNAMNEKHRCPWPIGLRARVGMNIRSDLNIYSVFARNGMNEFKMPGFYIFMKMRTREKGRNFKVFSNCELSPLLWGPAVNPGSFPALWNLLISRENPISQNFARGCTKNRRKKTSNTKKPHRKKITCLKTVLRIFQRLCFARLTPTQKYWKKFN